MSPDSLLRSFHREVVARQPEKFKIPALADVKSLFCKEYNPFFAGFGNRLSDVCSYLAVGVPNQRVFVINPSGTINTHNAAFHATYDELDFVVDKIFAPRDSRDTNKEEEFNDLQYWKADTSYIDDALPDLTDED